MPTKNHVTPVLALVFLSAFTSSAFSEDIYKWTDEQGNAHYSDQPSEKAKKITIQPITTVPAVRILPPITPPQGDTSSEKTNYVVKITSPQNNTAFHSPSGTVDISVNTTPQLSSSSQLIIRLDGSEVSRGQTTQVSLNNINRGTHSLSAEIIDKSGNSLSSDTSTFTIHRPTAK